MSARLRALNDYDILDTPPEPAFDDVATVAKALCRTPIALVTFVLEDRQWFKARSGTDLTSTPLSHSVCAHAVAQGSTLIIPDLRLDPRTRVNPLVTGSPRLRFYAGALVRSAGGETLGTVCVLDTEPRPEGLTREQVDGLEALARQVLLLMDMRRLVASRDKALASERVAFRSAEQRLALSEAAEGEMRDRQARSLAAQEAGRVGTFEAVVATNRFFTSPQLCRIFGLPEQSEYSAEIFENLVVPDDRALRSSAASREDGTASSVVEYRIRRADDGALRWVARRGDFVRGEDGQIVSFTGTVHDITERKLAELRQIGMIGFGDRIRDAATPHEIVSAAAALLGHTMQAMRAGFARLDRAGEVITVDEGWHENGDSSFRGSHSVLSFRRTVDRLSQNVAVVVEDAEKADWLADDRPAYAGFEIAAQISVPVIDRGKLVGFFFAHSATARSWSAEEVDFLRAVADRAYAAIARLDAEALQHRLNGELSHRLKNTFSLVQAMATRSLRGAADKASLNAFMDRLFSLSKAHDVLLKRDWRAARLRDVADAVLPLHVDASRLDISGPNILIDARTVLSLSMLLHELATNAVKHGALSNETGRVALSWKVDSASADASLVMNWDETGGPPAIAPEVRGMGTRLIAAGLAGTGGASVSYASTGLRAEFRALLSQISDQ